jgi:hypothetical protein
MATMRVSSRRVPRIHPITELRASFSDLAEKNFWYMTWLPSMRSIVGTRNSSARTSVRFPRTSKCVGGSAAWRPVQPPALKNNSGAAMMQVTVTREPIATSMYATEDIPARAVETMTKAAIR